MFSIIMAGGSGKRFWPFSRTFLPKQFLNIIGESTMLEQTVKRLEGIVKPEDNLIVINEEHSEALEGIEAMSKAIILREPVGKNTAPCVGLAALHLYMKDSDTPVAVLPADHYIPDKNEFQKTLKRTLPLAKEGAIVTIGIVPTRPETGYGYIWKGEKLEKFEEPAFMVKKFIEKPDLAKAVEYLQSGDYYWNAGMFVFTPKVILEEISLLLPDLYEKLEEIKKTIDTPEYYLKLKEIYPEIESISIDYGIMERTKRKLVVIPASFEWSDVGSWESLFALKSREADSEGNLLEGPGILVDTQNSHISNKTDKFIALLGLEDILIVNTDDVMLVARLSESQRIKEITELLKEKGLEAYL